MPIATPTLLTSSSSQTNVSTNVTATISPANGALVLVWQWVGSLTSGGIPGLVTPTTTLSGLSFAQAGTATVDSGSRDWRGTMWWAVRDGSGSGTITLRSDGTDPRWLWHVVEIASGFDAAAPIGEVAAVSNNASGSLTATFPNAPAATSLLVGSIGCMGSLTGIGNNGTAVELAIGPNIESTAHTGQTQYDDTPGATMYWDTLPTQGNLAVAVEVKAAAAASRVRRNLIL